MARLKKCLSLMPYLTTCLEIVIGDMIPINPPSQENKGRVEFGREFEILGPFRIGTRGTFLMIFSKPSYLNVA